MHNTPPRKPGPNTITGKANSSKNSTKHSLRSNPDKLLPGETQEDYNAIWDIWAAEYDSASPATARLIEFIVNDDRLVRFSVAAVIDAQIALAKAEFEAEPNQTQIDRLHQDLQTKLRYKQLSSVLSSDPSAISSSSAIAASAKHKPLSVWSSSKINPPASWPLRFTKTVSTTKRFSP